MESTQSVGWNPPQVVCNQSEEKYTCGDAIHAMHDYIRLTAITCQSFGLDKNKTARRLSYFLAPQTGLEPVTLRLTAACSTD